MCVCVIVHTEFVCACAQTCGEKMKPQNGEIIYNWFHFQGSSSAMVHSGRILKSKITELFKLSLFALFLDLVLKFPYAPFTTCPLQIHFLLIKALFRSISNCTNGITTSGVRTPQCARSFRSSELHHCMIAICFQSGFHYQM